MTARGLLVTVLLTALTVTAFGWLAIRAIPYPRSQRAPHGSASPLALPSPAAACGAYLPAAAANLLNGACIDED
jgi:hypothetical protein